MEFEGERYPPDDFEDTVRDTCSHHVMSKLAVPETVVDDAQPEFVAIHYWRHVVAYPTLAPSLAYATDHWTWSRWRKAGLAVGMAVLYGVGMEIGQSMLPHRSDFLWVDVLVNAIGASGVLAWYAVRPYVRCMLLGTLVTKRGAE